MSCISYAFARCMYLSTLSWSGGAGCVCVFDSHARVNILVWPLAGLVKCLQPWPGEESEQQFCSQGLTDIIGIYRQNIST